MKSNTSKLLRSLALLLAAMIFLCNFASSQSKLTEKRIELSVGMNHSSKNMRLDQWLTFGKHRLKVGITCILKVKSRDVVFSYRNRAFPQRFGEYFGPNLGYNFDFLKTKSDFRLYGFVDMQLSRPSFLQRYYYPIDVYYLLPNGNTWLPTAYDVQVLPPQLILESNVGIGCTLPLTDRLQLNQMAGVGIFLTKRPFQFNNSWFDFEGILPFLRIGVTWRWGK